MLHTECEEFGGGTRYTIHVYDLMNEFVFSSDVDECLTDNAGCSHSCTNTPGGYRCSCPDPDLTLSADNHTCKGRVLVTGTNSH